MKSKSKIYVAAVLSAVLIALMCAVLLTPRLQPAYAVRVDKEQRTERKKR